MPKDLQEFLDGIDRQAPEKLTSTTIKYNGRTTQIFVHCAEGKPVDSDYFAILSTAIRELDEFVSKGRSQLRTHDPKSFLFYYNRIIHGDDGYRLEDEELVKIYGHSNRAQITPEVFVDKLEVNTFAFSDDSIFCVVDFTPSSGQTLLGHQKTPFDKGAVLG